MVRCYPPQHFRANIPHNTCFPPSGAGGGFALPATAMLYEDGTAMLYEDGTVMLYEG